jgi:hypothetical protein
VLVFFSLSNTQLPHYLLYGATPVFIMMARYRERMGSMAWVLLPVLVFLGLLLALPEIAQRLIATSPKPELVAMLQDGLVYLDLRYRLVISAAIMAIVAIACLRRLPVWQRQVWISLVFTSVFIHQILPSYGAIQQGPVREAAQVAQGLNATLVMWQQDKPSFSVYLGRVVAIRPPQPNEVVFTGLSRLGNYPGAEVLFKRAGLVLLRILPQPSAELAPVESSPAESSPVESSPAEASPVEVSPGRPAGESHAVPRP